MEEFRCIKIECNVVLWSTKHKIHYLYLVPPLYSLHLQGELISKLAYPPQPSHLHSSPWEGLGQRRKDKSDMLTIISKMLLEAVHKSTYFLVGRTFLLNYTCNEAKKKKKKCYLDSKIIWQPNDIKEKKKIHEVCANSCLET